MFCSRCGKFVWFRRVCPVCNHQVRRSRSTSVFKTIIGNKVVRSESVLITLKGTKQVLNLSSGVNQNVVNQLASHGISQDLISQLSTHGISQQWIDQLTEHLRVAGRLEGEVSVTIRSRDQIIQHSGSKDIINDVDRGFLTDESQEKSTVQNQEPQQQQLRDTFEDRLKNL